MHRVSVAASFAVLLLASSSSGQERIKVFIDQDTSGPGGTDVVSIAMLLMAPNIEVVGIGVVGGDAWLDQAVYHTLKIVEVCGQPNVPVAAGSEDPLLNNERAMNRREALWGPKEGDGWHGAWGPEVPPKTTIPPAPGGPPTVKPVDKHAAELLIEMARKYPGELVLYTAGPLTNVALAIRLAPDIVGKIKAVYTDGWGDPREPHVQLLVGRGSGRDALTRAVERPGAYSHRRLPQDTDDERADRAHRHGEHPARQLHVGVLSGTQRRRGDLLLYVGRALGGVDHRSRRHNSEGRAIRRLRVRLGPQLWEDRLVDQEEPPVVGDPHVEGADRHRSRAIREAVRGFDEPAVPAV